MNFLRQNRFVLMFMALLVFCSVMVIRQFNAKQDQHVDIREAMILLHSGGYTNQADRLYKRLLKDLKNLSNKALIEDWQRTVILIDPMSKQPDNPIWKYHWTVRQEMEYRAESSIQRALKLAEEEK